MDHVYEGLLVFYEVYLDEYMDYHCKNHYKNLKENPVYEELKAIIDSMNPLRKFLGYPSIRFSSVVKMESERRKS